MDAFTNSPAKNMTFVSLVMADLLTMPGNRITLRNSSSFASRWRKSRKINS